MNPSNKKVTGGGLQSQNASMIFSPGRSNKPEPVNHDGPWKERLKTGRFEENKMFTMWMIELGS